MQNLRNQAYQWLRLSESFFKTDMIYLAKGGFWLTIGYIVSGLTGLALSVGFANLVPKEVFGHYKFILSLIGFIGAFSLIGMGTAVTQSISRGFEGSLSSGVHTSLKWGIISIIISLIGTGYYTINGNLSLAFSLLIAGTTSPIISALTLYGSFLSGKKEFQTSTIYNIARSILPVVFMLFIMIVSKNEVLIVAAYFLSILATAAYFHWRTIKKYRPNHNTDPSMIPYSKHLSAMNVVGTMAEYLDKILIFHFFGAAQLAIYSFAIAIPTQLRGFNKVFGTLIFPKASNTPIPILQNTLPRKALLMSFVAIIGVVAYFFISPYIYKIFFPQYIESIRFSQIYALTFLVIPAMLFNQSLLAHQRKRELYITKVTVPIIKIVMLLILLPIFGIWGAITSLLATQMLQFALMVIQFKRI
ncbi:MAG: oligosaccharide flippase family protein [bacterium]|nr:oligosaccharide flippase family protein [bacterium]